MHISDIDGEYIPRKGDKVKFRLCPMPPKFDKHQAVHIQIVDFTPEVRTTKVAADTIPHLTVMLFTSTGSPPMDGQGDF